MTESDELITGERGMSVINNGVLGRHLLCNQSVKSGKRWKNDTAEGSKPSPIAVDIHLG